MNTNLFLNPNQDVVYHLLQNHTELSELKVLSELNRDWNRVAKSNRVWKHIAEKIGCSLADSDQQYHYRVRQHIVLLAKKVSSLSKEPPFERSDTEIQALASFNPSFKQAKYIQNYLEARDQITLWQSIVSGLQFESRSCKEWIECARRLESKKNVKTSQKLDSLSLRQITSCPPAMFQMTNLVSLNLEKCGLHSIPDGISVFTKLRIFILKNNKLKALPKEICNLPRLEYLNISFNTIEVLPGEMERMDKLIILNATCNRLKSIPDAIGNLGNLRELYLSCNALKELPDAISKLENLEQLYVSHNQLATLSGKMGRLRKLRLINMNFNPVTENLPPTLKLGTLDVKVFGTPYDTQKRLRRQIILAAKTILFAAFWFGLSQQSESYKFPGSF